MPIRFTWHNFYIGTTAISHHQNSSFMIVAWMTGWRLDCRVRNGNNIVVSSCWNLVQYYPEKLKINLYVNNSTIFSFSFFTLWFCLSPSLCLLYIYIPIFPEKITTKHIQACSFQQHLISLKQSHFVPLEKLLDWLCCNHTIKSCIKV